jgi:hypothetical protein
MVAQAHADEEAFHSYSNSLNLAGYDPAQRFALAGGSGAATEELVEKQIDLSADILSSNGTNLAPVLREMLQNEALDPESGIRDPYNTHVGVGISYEAGSGLLRLNLLMVKRLVEVDTIPLNQPVGKSVVIKGRLTDLAYQDVLSGERADPEVVINVGFEPTPLPRTVADLRDASSDPPASRVIVYKAFTVTPSKGMGPGQNTAGQFSANVDLNYGGQPGLYWVRVWLHRTHEDVMATNVVFVVGANASGTVPLNAPPRGSQSTVTALETPSPTVVAASP